MKKLLSHQSLLKKFRAVQSLAFRPNMPLRRKILISNILIVLLALVIFVLSIHRIVFNQTLGRTTASSQQEVRLVSQSMETVFQSVQNFSKFALINQETQNVLSRDTGADGDVSALKSIHNTLAAMLETEPNIDSVIIESIGGDLYYTSNLTGVTSQSLAIYPKDKIDAAKGGAVWVDTLKPSFLSGMTAKNMISVCRVIMSMEKGTPIGYIYVNIDERTLARLYHNEQDNQNPTLVINQEGVVISAYEAALVSRTVEDHSLARWVKSASEGSRTERVGDKRYLVSLQRLDPYGWKVIHLVPTSELTNGYWKIALSIAVFGLISMLSAMVLSVIFARRLTRPLSELSEVIVEVGAGNFERRASAGSQDEVGRLGATFNEMVEHIQDLMLTIETEEKTKRLLELRLLYSQIKPHFLYNTLDTIRAMAVMTNAKEISSILKALGEFYRISLSNGQELIAAAQEKKHLESYLYIQQIRFKKLNYRISFEPGIESCQVPTMLLQPLVENAIHHGIRGMPDGGLCEITGSMERSGEERILCFIVRDNGKGMSEEEQRQIWLSSSEEEEYSFGLKNIQDRIQLRFGEAYGIVLSSEPGHGVEVKVRLPLIMQADEQGEGIAE
ncbi:sensor histidine kinase [Paenibacillus graminis]|uniref:cache domain-containing sensor histidine kinase n=1 Tax=Paenibacillus graminis TaxID=189425 RepID=UPI002DB6AC1D|nr:sensor histidine kinase [Paenibacillus graminis]MEC0169105.1 sensor histidine kinase [Paenibacillus graminis]